MTNTEDNDLIPGPGRGKAYPSTGLRKAVERCEQIRDANMARSAVPPLAYYKAWGFTGENGNSRQALAALNHYGLVDYLGRGKEREIKLSSLALRIVLDKIPDSKERAVALRVAALTPAIFARMWEKYGRELPPDYAIETFLTRDCEYSSDAAANIVGIYRDTFEYAQLVSPDNMPPGSETSHDIPPSPSDMLDDAMRGIGRGIAKVGSMERPQQTSTTTAMPMVEASAENDIKVLLDGERLRVSAYVDLKGAKRLLKALKANMALLEDDSDDASDRLN